MERAEWLKRMRSMAEALYDRISPDYWVKYGLKVAETHQAYLQIFLGRVTPGGAVLSAGCGAGLYDGLLLEAGYAVTGIDQSAGMLARARAHFPRVRYEQLGLQELAFDAAFDGVLCMDALEHVSPEDYPGILGNFARALRPGGVLYFTVDVDPSEELEMACQRAKALGLPVVYGELVDGVEAAYEQVSAMDQQVPGDLSDAAVYHFYPALEQVRAWLDRAGLAIEAEGAGDGYHHFVARKIDPLSPTHRGRIERDEDGGSLAFSG